MILYHADITNDNIVSVYQPKPPEVEQRCSTFFLSQYLQGFARVRVVKNTLSDNKKVTLFAI